MTHILPPHADLNLAPSSLHTALHMDPNQQPQQLQQQPQQAPQQAPSTSSKKRRKNDSGSDEAASPSETRRLRRSHEACARCRSKKIKCDSKHPRCTACATAGVPCQQEDRHRQTLTPRGHTEHIERRLLQCDALLKRHIAGFNLANIDEICAREGIEVDPGSVADVSTAYQFGGQGRQPVPPSAHQIPKYPYPPPHMVPPGYPHPGVPIPYGPPGSPYPPHLAMQGPYNPHMHPPYPHPPHHMPHPVQVHAPPPHASNEVKGQDPQSLDMSSAQALAKNFGVSPFIVSDTQLAAVDKEDLAVGSSGLSSGRDRDITESSVPRDMAKWIPIPVVRGNTVGAPPTPAPNLSVWLPKDRKMVNHIVDVYFQRLNFHRPVFARADFERRLNSLYEGEDVYQDQGFICSMYLILALGTLSELNHRATATDKDRKAPSDSPIAAKKLLPADWPEQDEFFERALAVKPDLRVTISSLQALILLQWYLYTERQGRTLWRLVGSLVRLAIELGLHHDPTSQNHTFTEEECQLRIRLWGIVMVHDRGTSILLGRPLAIAPYDSNTPRPSRGIKGQYSDFSEHFLLSHPIAEIQADIINSLYAPTRQSTDTIMRHATRIIKSMIEFRRQLPENYKWYFGGTEEWPLEKRQKLVQDITEDEGLTLLKIGISRILLLRALFSIKELDYGHRVRALVDAIVTSHNIIIVHNQLIRFPDIAFFVSPIPLHIAAMVILYGHMSHCERLSRQVMVEDVWMALDMLPRFRWRWERKDVNGGHPLIAKLAEKVLNVNLRSVGPTKDPVLLSELDWDTDSPGGMLGSPSLATQQVQQHMQQRTPTMAAAYPNGANSGAYGPQQRGPGSSSTTPIKNINGTSTNGTTTDKLAEVPAGLFYPFYPENPMGSMSGPQASGVSSETGSANGDAGSGNNSQDYSHLLAAAAAQPNGTYGCQSSQDSYMLEEKPPMTNNHGMQMWMNVGERGMPQFMTGS